MKKNLAIAISVLGILALIGSNFSIASPRQSHSVSTTNGWRLPFPRHGHSSSASANITTDEDIVAISKDGRAQFIDLPPADDSLGDRLIAHTPLFNTAGDQIGEFSVEEVRTKTTGNGQEQAVGTARIFGRGEITFQGEDTNQQTIVAAVTGGTQEFQNARGQVVVTFRQDSVRMGFHLLP
jgi:hypothetical protein